MRYAPLIVLALVAHTAQAQMSFQKKPAVQQGQTEAPVKAASATKTSSSAHAPTMHAFFNCPAASLEEAARWIENDVHGKCGLIPPADSVLAAWNRTFRSLHLENRKRLAAFIRGLNDVSAPSIGYAGKTLRLERVSAGGHLDLNGWTRAVYPDEHFGCDASGRCYLSLECGNPVPNMYIAPQPVTRPSRPRVSPTIALNPDSVIVHNTIEVEEEHGSWCSSLWCKAVATGVVLGAGYATYKCATDWCVDRTHIRVYNRVNAVRMPQTYGLRIPIP